MKIIALVVYLAYKIGVVLLLMGGWKELSLRVDIGVWIVYGVFSLIAAGYLLWNVVVKKLSLFSRWSLWWTVFLEWLAIGMAGLYLWFFRESSLIRVIWVIAALAPLHLIFFDMMRLLVSRWSPHYLANLQKPSWFFEYSLELPFLASVGFLGWQGVVTSSRMLVLWSAGLLVGVLLRHYGAGWFWQQRVKKLSRWLLKQNPLLFTQLPPIRDTNMLAPLFFAWQQYISRARNVQRQLLWMNPILSEEIQAKLAIDKEIAFGIEKPATMVALFWKTPELSPLQQYAFLESLATTVSEYVHQYDGFPFWEHDKLFVFFGFPYFYGHKNLSAIEFSQRILSEIQTISQEKELPAECSILVLSDSVRLGAVPTMGENASQLIPEGRVFQRCDLIRRASENLTIPLLIDKKVLEGLEARFFIQKTFKITLQNETLILCQVVD